MPSLRNSLKLAKQKFNKSLSAYKRLQLIKIRNFIMHSCYRTDQISCGIWSVNETGFTGFEVDPVQTFFWP